MDKGIIFASFGSTHLDQYEKSLGKALNKTRTIFNEFYINECMSSEIVRKRLRENQDKYYFNIKDALVDMEKRGIKDIYVMALYVLEGVEYNKLKMVADAYNFDNRLNITFTRGLLDEEKSIKEVAEILSSFKDDSCDAVVFMGHGSSHDEDEKYSSVQTYIDKQGAPVVVATVEGEVGMDYVLDRLKEFNAKRVKIAPFMLVAGDHAANDMASDDEDSWKTILKNEGYEVTPLVKGLCEFEKINDIFIKKLKDEI